MGRLVESQKRPLLPTGTKPSSVGRCSVVVAASGGSAVWIPGGLHTHLTDGSPERSGWAPRHNFAGQTELFASIIPAAPRGRGNRTLITMRETGDRPDTSAWELRRLPESELHAKLLTCMRPWARE